MIKDIIATIVLIVYALIGYLMFYYGCENIVLYMLAGLAVFGTFAGIDNFIKLSKKERR